MAYSFGDFPRKDALDALCVRVCVCVCVCANCPPQGVFIAVSSHLCVCVCARACAKVPIPFCSNSEVQHFFCASAVGVCSNPPKDPHSQSALGQ